MDGARDQLLAGTGFAQDQHVRIGGSNHFNLLLHAPQSPAGAYNLAEVMEGRGLDQIIDALIADDEASRLAELAA